MNNNFHFGNDIQNSYLIKDTSWEEYKPKKIKFKMAKSILGQSKTIPLISFHTNNKRLEPIIDSKSLKVLHHNCNITSFNNGFGNSETCEEKNGSDTLASAPSDPCAVESDKIESNNQIRESGFTFNNANWPYNGKQKAEEIIFEKQHKCCLSSISELDTPKISC